MSTALRPEFIVAIKRGQKTVATVAAFASGEWQDQGGGLGVYRVKAGGSSWNRDGRWVAEPGQAVSLYDADGCLALARDLAAKALGWPKRERAAGPPDMPRGSRVRVRVVARDQDAAEAAAEDPDDELMAELAEPCPRYELGITGCEPYQDQGRAWWVRVRLADGWRAVRCADCEVAG